MLETHIVDQLYAYDSWYLDTKLSTSYKDCHICLAIKLVMFAVSSHTNKARYLIDVDNTRVCLPEHLPFIDTGERQFLFDLAFLFSH